MSVKQTYFFQKLIATPYRKREIPFLLFFSFLFIFVFVRLGYYFFPQIYLEIRGIHIHHFTYGIVLLTIIGYYLLTNFPSKKALQRLAVLYGLGLGFAWDEFRLWLHLDDDYWTKRTYDGVIFIILIFLNILYFGDFWSKFGGKIISGGKKCLNFLKWKQ